MVNGYRKENMVDFLLTVGSYEKKETQRLGGISENRYSNSFVFEKGYLLLRTIETHVRPMTTQLIIRFLVQVPISIFLFLPENFPKD